MDVTSPHLPFFFQQRFPGDQGGVTAPDGRVPPCRVLPWTAGNPTLRSNSLPLPGISHCHEADLRGLCSSVQQMTHQLLAESGDS